MRFTSHSKRRLKLKKYYAVVNEVGIVTANNMKTLKRKASMLADNMNLDIDNIAIYHGKTFLNNLIRINERYNDGRMIRSAWE